MQNIGEQLGYRALENFRTHPALVTADAVGVELELEGFTSHDIEIARRHLDPLWTVTSDGSLRNGGVEFITTGGKGGETLHQAFERMINLLDNRVSFDASWRCSTHMHLNMLDFTCNQVARYMLVYAACEPVLFALAGKGRRSSNFCTPLGDSLTFHKRLIARLYDDTVANRLASQNTSKYTALNFQPLFGNSNVRPLGTIEFRGGRPMTSMQELLLQTNLLLSIKDFVRTFDGTEDAMLVKLNDGVFNTVFANGCAASLADNVSIEDLEASLIHSWLLLKSYQQGMKERTTGGSRYEIPESFTSSWRTLGATPSASFGNAEAPIQRRAPRTFWSAATSLRGMTYRGTYITESFGGDMTRENWPLLHHHLDQLQDPNLSRRVKADLMVSVLTDRTYRYRMNATAATMTAINWLLTYEGSTEQSPIGTIVRAAQNQALSITERRSECMDTGASPELQPRISTLSMNVDYMANLSATAKSVIAHLTGHPIQLLCNRYIWQHLMNNTVRLINKEELLRRYCERTGDDITGTTWPENIPALQAYQLFRICDVPSVNHIDPDYLPYYDIAVQIQVTLIAAGLAVPYVYRWISNGVGQRRLHLSTERTLTLSYPVRPSLALNHQSSQTRVSVTTGQRIY